MEDGLLYVVRSLLFDIIDEAHVVFFEISKLLPNTFSLFEFLLDDSVNYLLFLVTILQLYHPLSLGSSYNIPSSATFALGNKRGLYKFI